MSSFVCITQSKVTVNSDRVHAFIKQIGYKKVKKNTLIINNNIMQSQLKLMI